MKRLIPLVFLITFCASSHSTPQQEWSPHEISYAVAVSKGTVTKVDSKDPSGELESKLRYLTQEQLSLLRDVDNEYVSSPWYFVVRITEPASYTIRVTCRADGNHQIIAHSPRNPSFEFKDFRDVDKFQTFTLDFNARHSHYLIINCTSGNVYIDALSIEKKGD